MVIQIPNRNFVEVKLRIDLHLVMFGYFIIPYIQPGMALEGYHKHFF